MKRRLLDEELEAIERHLDEWGDAQIAGHDYAGHMLDDLRRYRGALLDVESHLGIVLTEIDCDHCVTELDRDQCVFILEIVRRALADDEAADRRKRR